MSQLFHEDSLDRREFLKIAGMMTAAEALAGLAPVAGFAQAAAEASIATQLVNSVGGAFGKQIGTLAFGQIMSAIGIDTDGTAAMTALLNQILADLQQLMTTVGQIQQELEVGLDQLYYTLAMNPLVNILSINYSIGQAMKALMTMAPTPTDTAEQRAAKLVEIAAQKTFINEYFNADYRSALNTWNDCILGLNGMKGLISTWSNLTYRKASKFFGPGEARRIQQNWDYLDAQQALTAAYLIDYCNANNLGAQAKQYLALYYSNRASQLKALRSTVRRQDSVKYNDGAGNVSTRTTQLNYFPMNTVIALDTNGMWYLKLSHLFPETDLFTTIITQDAYNDTGKALSGPWGWAKPTNNAFVNLANYCGGDVGGNGGHRDHFRDAMTNLGFVFPSGEAVRVWSGEGVRRSPQSFRPDIFVEGDTWSHDPLPPKRPDLSWPDGIRTAMLLFVRNIFLLNQQGGELYWYPS